MNVREGEEKMAIRLFSATVKEHQMGVSSQVRVSKPDKLLIQVLNKRLWNSFSGDVKDAMPLHQVLKGFGEIAGRKTPMTSTQIL